VLGFFLLCDLRCPAVADYSQKLCEKSLISPEGINSIGGGSAPVSLKIKASDSERVTCSQVAATLSGSGRIDWSDTSGTRPTLLNVSLSAT
jgi:hypothetical protein